ncbi:MAG TPA: GAF domain-containing protein, partial [Candidatus Sulfotelmatobacter sp.]|nr:GAF domain-containing protein [Candidatus Sulfotelmatobacter sp.]
MGDSVPITRDDAAADIAEGLLQKKPTQRDALQALLAFSALHEQVRRRKALAARNRGIDAAPSPEFEEGEQFVLDEVLQLVAERAVAITGADGLAIALAENEEIVLRAAAGAVRPDIGARIDRDSAFSGASFRMAQVVICDDTETDPRVNLQACRRLGARSMVAVPLCGRRRVIGLLEAFSSWPFAFNDSDVRNLTLLAELVVGALKPEDEDRFAESAQAASAKLQAPARAPAVQNAASGVETSATQAPLAPAPTASNKPAPVPLAASPAAAANEPAISVAAPISEISKTATKPIPKTSVEPVVPIKAPVKAPVEIAGKIPVEAAAPAEAIVEPELKLGLEPEPSSRVWKIVLLIGIVLLAAFAAGIWWKWRTGQLGSSIITGTKTASATPAAKSNPQPAANAASAAPSATPSTDENQDLGSEAEEPAGGPATAEEIAKFPKITGVRPWSSSDSTTVVLDLEDQVQYEAHRLTGPDRIYVDLHDTQLAPELANKSIEIGESL